MTITIAPSHTYGRVRVTFRYDPNLVELLKTIVPASSRTWDANAKAWHIGAAWAADLARYAQRLGHEIVDLRTDGTPAPAAPASDWAAALFDAVGPDRADAVHRALTRVLHPDNTRTGDTGLQRTLNVARDALQAV